MADNPFLSIVSTAEAFELTMPTREELLNYQGKLLGLWEQQQRVLGYTDASIANNSRNLDTFLRIVWEIYLGSYDIRHRSLLRTTGRKGARVLYQEKVSIRYHHLSGLPSFQTCSRYAGSVIVLQFRRS